MLHVRRQVSISPAPIGPQPGTAPVVAYPTLEDLFGSMDYCTCDECRSILSPAAYLVDLLQFIYCPSPQKQNPQAVLFGRRPDIQYLPLTCENTNTALPYIDLVNETLEYFVANSLSLANYTGHNTDGTIPSDELLASPQFENDPASITAYTMLKSAYFPPPLPFHQPLELLRLHFQKFGIQLQDAMAALRSSDAIEGGTAAYGWQDILIEQIGVSRSEYQLLTDSALTLQQIYGYSTLSDSAVIAALSNFQNFSRRVGVSYDDLISILKTHFINPSSMLIPRLERLNVPFTTLQELKNGTLSDADFEALLPAGINPAEYGGNIPAWVKDPTNYARIMRIITIADPSGSNNLCPIEVLQFRYANPDTNANTLHAIDFVRLLRFIRLWRKLGLTIEQTDDVITALYPASNLPTGTNDAADLQNLDAGFKVLLLRIGFAFQVMNRLQLKADQDLPGLLACWAPIGTFGEHSLYRTMFLTPTLLKQDPAFADDGYGNFLQDSSQTLFAHEPALRAALNLTGAEFALITNTLGFDAATLLTLPNISAVYRQGWMARMLKLSVVEFLLLTRFTGLDPFAALDPAPVPPTEPPTIRLIRLVQALRAASLKPVQALYLIWNQDISGISAPPDAKITGLARTLRADFAAVESQFALVDDPNGDIAKALMVLVYGTNATDFFFGLLNNTLSVSVSYDNKEPMLPQPVLDAASGRLSYDDLRKQLTYTGVLDVDTLAALESTIGTNGPLKDAVDKLAAANHEVVDPFFAAYPELGPLYTTYVTSNASPQTKRTELLQQFLPDLKRRRKQEQALAAMTAAAGTDSSYAPVLLDDVTVLHAAPDPNIPHRDQLPVIYDLTDVEASGLSVQFFLTNNLAAPADITVNAVPTLSYAAKGSNPLPTGNGGSPIAGIWRGYLDAPQNGFYKISVATDPDALVALEIDGVEVPMDPPNVSSSAWSNASPISLTAGVLTSIALTVTTLTNTLTVSWQSTGIGRQVIPGTYLYPAILVDHLRTAYVRFLKATSLATSLSLKADEIAYLASNGDFQVNGQGWLNTLSVSGSPDTQTAIGLRDILCAVLDFARIKAALSPNDERLLSVLKQPEALLPNGDSALLTLTRWDQGSLNALLTLFFPNVPTPLANLAHLENFRRVYDAYAFVTACGISAAALISALTNDPTAQTVSDFQAALRARYAEADWLTVIKPINDTMRVRQRDALVAYILQHFGDQPPTICDNVLEKIDTPDKLFEFFLMDVEMDSCMQTSRIRHALSSVQLFIERCLRNLEPCVDSSDIQAAQWEWMKRYRVWEANRKVFLWPENWLDPELRDDQSQFFKDTMSELLQSDITDDAAQTALLNYLTKLEEVAKLEVCGTYYVESCDPEKTNDIVHVVARTAGAHRKYYYRRLEFGTWTPWEQIKLDIEDNPIIPVVWKGRLLLFWLQILKQTPIDPNSMSAPLPSSDPNATLANQPLSSLQAGLRSNATAQSQITVQAVLCWSEYYNGKWQPMKTSDVSRPTTLGLFSPTGSGAFDRAPLQLGVSEEGNDALLRVSIFGYGSSSFLLYNTHSLPVRQEDAPKTPSPSGQSQERRMYSYGYYRDYALVLTYGTVASPDSIWRSVLAEGTGSFYPIPLTIIQPSNPLQNVWDSPFFFQDSRHVFFVTTTDQQVWVPDSPSYGIAVKPSFIQVAKIPPLILPTDPHVQLESKLQNESSKIGPDSGIIDPAATRRFVTEDAFINQGFGTTIRVMYGDRQIGPLGTLPTSHTEV